MPPNISVILPVYNGEGTIRKAIESILQQTCSDFELLLINDGSTDHTLEVVAGLSGQGGLPDPRISIYDRPHRGLASALNYGIRQASGTYIARMDADDYAYPNRFALQLCYLEQNPDIDICATQVIFEGDPENEGLIQYVTWQNRLTSHRQMYLNRFVDSPVIHPTLIIRKSVFTAHGFYPEKKGPEDFRLWLQWMAQGVRFGKVEMKLFKWYDSTGRLTRQHPHYNRDIFFRLKAKYFAEWFNSRPHKDNASDIWICGTGRHVNHRTRWLSHFGITIKGNVDIKCISPTKHKIRYSDIHNLSNPFFLSYVSDRKGRMEIHAFMTDSGYTEGVNFYMMA